MDVTKVIALLNNKEVNIRLYFTRKRNQNDYVSYSPTIGINISNELKKLISDYIEKVAIVEQVDFSPIGYKEETIESIKINEIANFNHVIESFSEDRVSRNIINESIIRTLTFYCLALSYVENKIEKTIYFFRRITKFKKLSARGMLGFIENNALKKIESNLLGIDGDIDLIAMDNEILILNHVSLERIFSMSDQYLESAKKTIEIIKNADRIDNFDVFKSDCLADKRIIRILTRMQNEDENLKHCFENFENVLDVIYLFELEIDTKKENGKEVIIYDNKDQLFDFIRLVRDSYCKSYINERNVINDAL